MDDLDQIMMKNSQKEPWIDENSFNALWKAFQGETLRSWMIKCQENDLANSKSDNFEDVKL